VNRYAASQTDLDRVWNTPAGAALLDAALDGQDADHAEVVTADGADAAVLRGTDAQVAALVDGLLTQGVRVYEQTGVVPGVSRGRWTRTIEAPVVADLPDDSLAFSDDESPRIDDEFEALCGVQTEGERAALRASIVEHGCRDPLVVWADRDILLDGHNRLAICRELDAPFDTVEYAFPDRDAARNWIIDNALARRSLTVEQRRYLRGKRFATEKKPEGRPRKELPHVEGVPGETAVRIADREGVSRATIERDAEFARALDALGSKARAAVLAGDVKLSRAQLAQAAEARARTPADLLAVKEASAAPPLDVLTRLDALASRVSRLVEEALSLALRPADRARLANVWAVGAAVERLAAALPADAAPEAASHG
jgi:hypothetical protein